MSSGSNPSSPTTFKWSVAQLVEAADIKKAILLKVQTANLFEMGTRSV